jgi:hypothetical protein
LSYEYEYVSGSIATTVCRRLYGLLGGMEVVIVADDPKALMEAVEVVWKRMTRQHQIERDGSEDAEVLVRLSGLIARMQNVRFGTDPYSDQVAFMTLADFTKSHAMPRYLYVCQPVGPELARQLGADVAYGGMTVVFGRKK